MEEKIPDLPPWLVAASRLCLDIGMQNQNPTTPA
jgi:hypothetical protein